MSSNSKHKLKETVTRSALKSIIKEIIKNVFKEMTTTAHASPVNMPAAFSKRKVKEDDAPIEEMTTTGDVGSYNIPSAFSRKGGSHKGVEGSAKLGYNLTPLGKKDMNRQSDSLNESTGNPDKVRFTIKRNPDTGEWMVKVYINGKYSEKATYYTDDKEDAVTTGRAMKDQYAAQGFIV